MVIIELPIVLRSGLAAYMYMIAGLIDRVAFLMHLRMVIFVHQIIFIKLHNWYFFFLQKCVF